MEKHKGCAVALPVVLWMGFVMPANAALVISEIFYDASGPDAGNVFVELFGSPGESLDGLVLEGVNGSNGSVYQSINLAGLVPSDGVFVIGDDNGGTTSVANADFIAAADFQNGPDSVVLRNGDTVLDAVGYGIFSATDFFAGEGASAPDPAAGFSIARLALALDSNDNSVDFSVFEFPTPGIVASVAAVPTPPALLLFSSGLIGLARLARGTRKSS
ncbi:hypothetical protein DFR30_0320 [Thiogranum longum]|uniref:Secreted protein n=1 Tax=Thiogranum longum TaxID=1537524 RepID=A0A4R1HAE4_9GAMM|nr:hypothetical protein [Thiogranum longum]TCK17100.1 hypothetical protein DFR30_0320 [Thiogranum longum]